MRREPRSHRRLRRNFLPAGLGAVGGLMVIAGAEGPKWGRSPVLDIGRREFERVPTRGTRSALASVQKSERACRFSAFAHGQIGMSRNEQARNVEAFAQFERRVDAVARSGQYDVPQYQ